MHGAGSRRACHGGCLPGSPLHVNGKTSPPGHIGMPRGGQNASPEGHCGGRKCAGQRGAVERRRGRTRARAASTRHCRLGGSGSQQACCDQVHLRARKRARRSRGAARGPQVRGVHREPAEVGLPEARVREREVCRVFRVAVLRWHAREQPARRRARASGDDRGGMIAGRACCATARLTRPRWRTPSSSRVSVMRTCVSGSICGSAAEPSALRCNACSLSWHSRGGRAAQMSADESSPPQSHEITLPARRGAARAASLGPAPRGHEAPMRLRARVRALLAVQLLLAWYQRAHGARLGRLAVGVSGARVDAGAHCRRARGRRGRGVSSSCARANTLSSRRWRRRGGGGERTGAVDAGPAVGAVAVRAVDGGGRVLAVQRAADAHEVAR